MRRLSNRDPPSGCRTGASRRPDGDIRCVNSNCAPARPASSDPVQWSRPSLAVWLGLRDVRLYATTAEPPRESLTQSCPAAVPSSAASLSTARCPGVTPSTRHAIDCECSVRSGRIA
jgi:hypothetical protein